MSISGHVTVHLENNLFIQPRSQGVLTAYADYQAEWTPWYTAIKSAQKMGRLAAIMDLTVPRQRKSTENGRCSSANSTEDKLRNYKQTL